jgi:uncharacterized membrane protein
MRRLLACGLLLALLGAAVAPGVAAARSGSSARGGSFAPKEAPAQADEPPRGGTTYTPTPAPTDYGEPSGPSGDSSGGGLEGIFALFELIAFIILHPLESAIFFLFALVLFNSEKIKKWWGRKVDAFKRWRKKR